MNFVILTVSIILISTFVGTAFAQTTAVEKTFTDKEIADMKNKAVILTMHEVTFTIELFPEEAPNAVYHFLKLVDSGYYDGIVFHRIIPGFMIQAGDPNTKDPDFDPDAWGRGGPGYNLKAEFNTIKHERGIVSMARSEMPNSAGSQFFIVHKAAPQLDGKYTVFGRLVPGLPQGLDNIAELETDSRDRPLDVFKATIQKAGIIDGFSSPFTPPEKNDSIIKQRSEGGGDIDVFYSSLFDVSFDLPYRWALAENSDGDVLGITMKPGWDEHNAQMLIEKSGFEPLVLVGSEPRTNAEKANDLLSTGFFSVARGDTPSTLSNYVFENEVGQQAHMVVTTQNVDTSDGEIQFKVLQIHFNNSESNYSIIYVNTSEMFRYEVNSFVQVLDNLEIMIDGKMQKVEFDKSPVFQQLIRDAKAKPEPEALPPARIGGCLIATASYGSELAPQVQLLREIRDNTVLQTQSGISFMNGFNHFYYSFSPTVADYERENPIFKEAVKLTLTPLLASLTLLQYTDINSENEMLGYGIGLILLNIGMYFVAPAVLITKIRSFYKLQ